MTKAAGERGGPADSPSESGGPDGGAAPEAFARASIGEYLAQQRKLRGISIQELCARTKIPRRNIERLESGALDDQLDGFARGFVRTLAEALGLDADEAVMRLMREPDAEDERAAQLERRTHRLRIGAVAVAVVVALLLTGALLDWLADSDEAPVAPLAEREVTYRSDVVRALARDGTERPRPEPPVAPEPGAGSSPAASSP